MSYYSKISELAVRHGSAWANEEKMNPYRMIAAFRCLMEVEVANNQTTYDLLDVETQQMIAALLQRKADGLETYKLMEHIAIRAVRAIKKIPSEFIDQPQSAPFHALEAVRRAVRASGYAGVRETHWKDLRKVCQEIEAIARYNKRGTSASTAMQVILAEVFE